MTRTTGAEILIVKDCKGVSVKECIGKSRRLRKEDLKEEMLEWRCLLLMRMKSQKHVLLNVRCQASYTWSSL